MGYLPASKHGDCNRCPATNTACIKRGKELLCLNCARNEKTKEQISKANERNRIRGLSSLPSNKEMVSSKDVELERWFVKIAKIIDAKPYCMECGARIFKGFYRAASAHVLPKRKDYGFPSVKTHPDNYLILGAGCGCHGKYDTSWEDAAQMKVFPLAIEKFIKIYPAIAKSEYKNLPEVFLQEIEPQIL